MSAIETDLESHSTVPVVASEVLSETNDHVTTLPGGRAKVSLCCNIFANMDALCSLVLQV